MDKPDTVERTCSLAVALFEAMFQAGQKPGGLTTTEMMYALTAAISTVMASMNDEQRAFFWQQLPGAIERGIQEANKNGPIHMVIQ